MYRLCIPYLATFWIAGSQSGRWAENWASIVPCPTNSTLNSAIYKLTSGPAGWLTQHCTSIVLCPPNNVRSSVIYKLTYELQGWWGEDSHCLRMVIPINYLTISKNIIFNIKLSLSDNWTQRYKTVGIPPSAIYKLTTGFDIVCSSMLQIMHSNVQSDTI
jgi:hypothetical protein